MFRYGLLTRRWPSVFSLVLFYMVIVTMCSSYNYLSLNITGKFIIGAMFPIHNLESGSKCGDKIDGQAGIQNLEALIFSLEKVNREVLKDIDLSLGVLAFDTCYSDTVALERALQFVKLQKLSQEVDVGTYVCENGKPPKNYSSTKIVGVVGSATSSVSIQLASFLRLFKIPQISYSATSPELSDITRYEYFMRTVASDEYQAKAIADILKSRDWTYVTVVYEDTSYGQMGVNAIQTEAKERDICIAASLEVKRYFSTTSEQEAQLHHILETLTQFNNTEGQIVVILFTSQDIVEGLFELVKKSSEHKQDTFVWIGSDAWTGRTLKPFVQDIGKNALGVQPEIRDVPEFDKYFQRLHPNTYTENPWFKEYWEQLFDCTVNKTQTKLSKKKECSTDLEISFEKGTYNKNLNTYSVMDAVYAIAYALKAMQKDRCGTEKGNCDSLSKATAADLKEYLLNVTFVDPSGQNFQFTKNNGPALYSIMRYEVSGGTSVWKQVGKFDGYSNNSSQMDWEDESSLNDLYRPSMCSVQCKKGEAKARARNTCCWTCIPCTEFQYLEDSTQLCKDCPDGELPNQTQTGCTPIPETTMNFSNTWAIISMIISCCGLIVTTYVAAVFYRSKETPIIMASGKELSFVLLVGIFISYLSSFVFVAYPTPVACGATRIMLGLCYSLCYAAILVKTNRIYRVFNIKTKKPKKVRFINAKSQLLITFGIVLVEVAALATWLLFDPPTVTHVYPTKQDNILVCEDSKYFAYLGALVYPFFLMILCVVYAIKTRNTPDGFNETRFITFGSYSFCIMWIAFISIYFSVANNTIRIVALSFASTVNATVTLITLFITKVYVVIWRPQKNTRENVMSRRRTRSYETVEINNMSNLSRMVSAVSTWHSVYPTIGSEDCASPTRFPGHQNFANKLSVSVVSINNIDKAKGASNISLASAPTDQRRYTESEIIGKTYTQIPSKLEKQLETESLQKTLKSNEIANALLTPKDSLRDSDSLKDDTNNFKHRRSLRSLRSRRKSRRSSPRPRSADAANDIVPNIIVTSTSTENKLEVHL